jgi:hypothetical protein
LEQSKNSSEVLAAIILLVCCLPCASAQLLDRKHIAKDAHQFFDVYRSIEMSRFERTDAAPQFSPNGRYFAVVTSRGIVESDNIESTLRIFRSRDVLRYLRSEYSLPPRGSVIAKVAVTPKAEYHNSYEPVISAVRWLPTSKGLLFLAQNLHGNRQLCRINLSSSFVQKLTRADHDISQYDAERDSIVYRRTASIVDTAGEPINAYARDVSGVPLPQIIFPLANARSNISDLWVIQGRHTTRLMDPVARHPITLSHQPPPIRQWSPLSLSPDGKKLVVLLPVRSIPASWQNYEPALASLRPRFGDAQDSASHLPVQYSLIDLRSHQTIPLVKAPNAYQFGYGSRNLALWSLDGRSLLVTNTYVPLKLKVNSSDWNGLRPCAALVITLISKKNTCVVFDRGTNAPLVDASITDPDDIFLRFANAPIGEHYRCRHGIWQMVPPVVNEEDHLATSEIARSRVLSIAIRQDLNTPQALWATDTQSRRSKRLWDPNPQLSGIDLGEATIYRWKDATGYPWRGGLVKPPNYDPGRRYPLVIQTHGFEENEFLADGAYTTAFSARALAAAGIIVLQMADRWDDLESSSEASHRVLAFESAIEQLSDDGLIDPRRVGVIGFSRTCYHVESALIHNPKLFAAATIADGIDESYMQYLLASVGGLGSEPEALYGGKPLGAGLERWVQDAPGFHLDLVQTPLRIEAIAAPGVLSEWETYSLLWTQAKPVDLIYYPLGQHILQRPLERLASEQGNVDWFRFWLNRDEDPDPAKTQEYARWRHLLELKTEKHSPNS